VHLYDLVPLDDLTWLMANGYVREQDHPSEPLRILNYTDRAQTKPELFEQVESLQYCRGLIWNTTDGTIVARPFHKFWNHGQAQAADIPLHAEVEVIDKVDGSLGILYFMPNKQMWAVATRGSFTSDQAVHATEKLWSKYADWAPLPEDTVLVEIVYPDNRIVLDYGDLDDLILLGSVEIETGYVNNPRVTKNFHGWPGEVARHFSYGSLAEALEAEPRPNAEGYVVRQRGTDRMVKLKQEDYLQLHRIVFGLSTRRVYEAILAGKTLSDILEPLPDEFHKWTHGVYTELQNAFKKRFSTLQDQYYNTMSYAFHSGIVGLDEDEGWYVDRDKRGALARLFKEHDDDAWAAFAQLDGKDITKKIWKELEPPAGQLPGSYEPKVYLP
jgi:RNA ligase